MENIKSPTIWIKWLFLVMTFFHLIMLKFDGSNLNLILLGFFMGSTIAYFLCDVLLKSIRGLVISLEEIHKFDTEAMDGCYKMITLQEDIIRKQRKLIIKQKGGKNGNNKRNSRRSK